MGVRLRKYKDIVNTDLTKVARILDLLFKTDILEDR